MQKLKPVHIDGALLVIFGIVSSVLAYLTGEEAKQYLSGEHIFWLKAIGAGLDAGTAMLIAFRSNSVADSRNDTVGQPPARPEERHWSDPPQCAPPPAPPAIKPLTAQPPGATVETVKSQPPA